MSKPRKRTPPLIAYIIRYSGLYEAERKEAEITALNSAEARTKFAEQFPDEAIFHIKRKVKRVPKEDLMTQIVKSIGYEDKLKGIADSISYRGKYRVAYIDGQAEGLIALAMMNATANPTGKREQK